MIIEECHNQREGLLLSVTLITPPFLLINLQNGQYRYRRRRSSGVTPWIVNFFHQSVAVRSIPRNCFVFHAFINFDSRSRMIQQGGLVEPTTHNSFHVSIISHVKHLEFKHLLHNRKKKKDNNRPPFCLKNFCFGSMLFLFPMILYSNQPPMSSNNTPTTTAFLKKKKKKNNSWLVII
jgi:hypothetical protein